MPTGLAPSKPSGVFPFLATSRTPSDKKRVSRRRGRTEIVGKPVLLAEPVQIRKNPMGAPYVQAWGV